MTRTGWQFYGWWGIVLPAVSVTSVTSALVLAAMPRVRRPERAAH